MGDINSKVTSGPQVKQAFHLVQCKTQGSKHVPICWAGRGKDNRQGLEMNGCHQAPEKVMSSGSQWASALSMPTGIMGFRPCYQESRAKLQNEIRVGSVQDEIF
jgi:hypothetical protein